MVERFDEINEENVKDMSLEDLQSLALSGKDELVNSRKVIGDLNKKIKKPSDDDGEEQKGMTREELDEYYNQKRKEESFSDFLNKNNFDEDQKKKAEDYFAKGLSNEEIARLTGVNTFENNQRKANGMGVGNGTAGNGGELFGGDAITYDDYSKLDANGKNAYKSFAKQKFGALKFARGQREDY